MKTTAKSVKTKKAPKVEVKKSGIENHPDYNPDIPIKKQRYLA